MNESETSAAPSAPAEDSALSPAFMPEAIGHRLPARVVADGVAEHVHRAGFPELNETLVAAETDKTIAEIRAGTPLPLDADASKGDACFLADVAEVKDRASVLRNQLTQAEETVTTSRRKLAELSLPLTIRQWAALIGALSVLTLIGVLTLKALLASSFDELLFRGYFEGLNIADASVVSARHAGWLVIWAASFLLGGKALAVVGSSGRLSRFLKLLLVGTALLFSGSFAIVRLSEGWSLAAVAVSLVELALLASYTLVLLALSSVLATSAERLEAYRAAATVVALEERRQEELRADLTLALRDYETRRRALAQREDDCRRLPLFEAVARTTVETESLVAAAELMTAAARAAYTDLPPPDAPASGEKAAAQ